jgi:hypothetical protein
MEDYDYIIEQVKYIVEAISGLSRSVFIPITHIFGFLKKFDSMPFMGKKKDKEADKE